MNMCAQILLETLNRYGKSTIVIPKPVPKNVHGWVRNPNSMRPQASKHFSATSTLTHKATVKAQLT